jgi:hypothetical protein
MNASLKNPVCVNRLEAGRRAKFLPRKLPLLLVPSGMEFHEGALDLLRRWPELSVLIQEAACKLRESFGASAQIVLERFDDPEAENEDPSLYLVVETTLRALDARQALDRFEDNWWMENAERSNNRLHFSVEFL